MIGRVAIVDHLLPELRNIASERIILRGADRVEAESGAKRYDTHLESIELLAHRDAVVLTACHYHVHLALGRNEAFDNCITINNLTVWVRPTMTVPAKPPAAPQLFCATPVHDAVLEHARVQVAVRP